jgi:4'-phosphopantetheinyl transferase
VLTPKERAKEASFVFETNRREYLVTRALCRTVLAIYLSARPGELMFRNDDHGRPELDPPQGVRFNLTNTVALVACAVSLAGEVGVDAEPLERADDVLGVAEIVFTPRERRGLSALDAVERRARAIDLWTCKEAYIKARGMGMSLPVNRFELDFDGPRIRLLFLENLDDDAARWDITTRVIEDHVVATCVERTNAPEEIIVRRADLRELLARRMPG